jgi:hypothetical protein
VRECDGRGRARHRSLAVLAGIACLLTGWRLRAQEERLIESLGAVERTTGFQGLVGLEPSTPGREMRARIRIAGGVRSVEVNDSVGPLLVATIRARDGETRLKAAGATALTAPQRWHEEEVVVLDTSTHQLGADGSASRPLAPPGRSRPALPTLLAVAAPAVPSAGRPLAILRDTGSAFAVGAGESAGSWRVTDLRHEPFETLTVVERPDGGALIAHGTRVVRDAVSLAGPPGQVTITTEERREDSRAASITTAFDRAYRLLGVTRRDGAPVAILEERAVGLLAREGERVGRYRVVTVAMVETPGPEGEARREHRVEVLDVYTGRRGALLIEERVRGGAVVSREEPHRPAWMLTPGPEPALGDPAEGF